MRVHWNQFSPSEKNALIRYFVFHNQEAPVTPEAVWHEMQRTHFLSCVATPAGGAMVGFEAVTPGQREAVALADDMDDGIYMAALKVAGVDLEETGARPARRA